MRWRIMGHGFGMCVRAGWGLVWGCVDGFGFEVVDLWERSKEEMLFDVERQYSYDSKVSDSRD